MSNLRIIEAANISQTIKLMCGEANTSLPKDIINSLKYNYEKETSSIGKEVLSQLIENAKIAKTEKIPICQDCGLVIVFADIGQDLHIKNGNIITAINKGISDGYDQYHLRKSLCHPFTRKNTNNNLPATIHTRIVPGNKLRLWLVPKGGGSENMSKVVLLPPSQGLKGIKKTILETVNLAGPNPCPPIILGIAIGGSFDEAALRAKRCLIQKIDSINTNMEAATLETELLNEINNLGIGPAGLGGNTTCLRVFVSIKECHIASLPLAINIQCHAARHKGAIL